MELYDIFDMDGTLYNSIYNTEMPYYRQFADVLHEEFGISEEQRRAAEEFYVGAGGGKPAGQQYAEIMGMFGLPIQMAEDLARKYVTRVTSRIYSLYGDAVDCLRRTRESGNRSCVSTGIPQQHLGRVVAHHGIGKYLDFWLGADDKHPDKAMHREAVRENFGISDDEFRERTYLVGDAFRDMQLALEWGVKTPVYVNRQNLDLSHIAKGLEEKHVDSESILIIPSLSALKMPSHA